jgi:hypothetical protein
MPNAEELNDIGPIGEALLRRARGTSHELTALLHDVEVHANIEETRVTFHCHCLKFDGNKRARIDDLVAAVSDHLLDFAVPRSAIAEAHEALNANGSTAPLMRLRDQAAGLFTDLANTGEGGELLLYVLAESVLRLPQLLCKMGLKTNSRMHVHGADGLHAGVDPNSGHLLLYWGESKLYQNVTDAIRECFASIAPMLKSTGESGQGERDMQLLGRHADLADDALTDAIKMYLDPRDEHFNKLEFCGLCLVGFDSAAYPPPNQPGNHDDLLSAIVSQIPQLKTSISKRLHEEELISFAFHVICVPFPSVGDFRSKLLKQMGLS